MHVVELGPWPPPYGGVQTHLVALRARMARRGISSEVLNITAAPDTATPGVRYPRSAAGLLRALLMCRCDVIHLHVGGQLTSRLLALTAFCTALPGRRTVLTFHSGGFASSEAGQRLHSRSFAARVLRRLDAIVVVNEEQRAFFSRLGCDAGRLHRILPHSDPDAARIERVALGSTLDEFLARHARVLVSVGLLEPEYEFQLLIESLPALRAGLGDLGLIIVGSGSLQAHLMALASASVARDHLMLTLDLDHDRTLRLIQRASALVRATRYDGDAISVREALALGTPVAATDTGMRPDGCHLFPVGSREGLFTVVKAALHGTRIPAAQGDELDQVLALYERLAA